MHNENITKNNAVILLRNKTGFTLIEMLVVVLIMGILASIALPQYQQSVMKARYVKLMPLVKAIKNAEEEYWYMHRKYAFDFDELGFSIKGFSSLSKTGSEQDHVRRHTINKQQVYLQLDENGSGAPMVGGYLVRGGKRVGYYMYLDHMGINYKSYTATRYCYSNTKDTSDWRYKLCASVTGSSSPEEGWPGNARFKFLK